MTTTMNEAWVVLVTEVIECETSEETEVTCSVVSEEYATREEAEDFACDVQHHNPSFIVEVCTALEAEECISE